MQQPAEILTGGSDGTMTPIQGKPYWHFLLHVDHYGALRDWVTGKTSFKSIPVCQTL